MLERFGIRRRDRRNLAVVMVFMGLLMMILTPEPIVVRFAVGVIGACISGTVFLLVTIALKSVASY